MCPKVRAADKDRHDLVADGLLVELQVFHDDLELELKYPPHIVRIEQCGHVPVRHGSNPFRMRDRQARDQRDVTEASLPKVADDGPCGVFVQGVSPIFDQAELFVRKYVVHALDPFLRIKRILVVGLLALDRVKVESTSRHATRWW